MTFKMIFTIYLFNNETSHYLSIIPGCVQTIHGSSGLEVLYCTGEPGMRINALPGQFTSTPLEGFQR